MTESAPYENQGGWSFIANNESGSVSSVDFDTDFSSSGFSIDVKFYAVCASVN